MRTIKEWIKDNEGFRQFAYKCSQGFTTIGWGRNCDTKGVSTAEAEILLDNDISECKMQLEKLSWYTKQPREVQDALINMCFNLGITKLCKFEKMIAALDRKDYLEAANEALSSQWASQVGLRATQIANQIRLGK